MSFRSETPMNASRIHPGDATVLDDIVRVGNFLGD
jgi:hypothetical protein